MRAFYRGDDEAPCPISGMRSVVLGGHNLQQRTVALPRLKALLSSSSHQSETSSHPSRFQYVLVRIQVQLRNAECVDEVPFFSCWWFWHPLRFGLEVPDCVDVCRLRSLRRSGPTLCTLLLLLVHLAPMMVLHCSIRQLSSGSRPSLKSKWDIPTIEVVQVPASSHPVFQSVWS